MKIRSLSAWAVAAGVAVLTWGSASTAQASDVYWSLGVATPGVVVGVGNGYSVYTTPQPRYYPPPPSAYFAPPAPVYYAPPAYNYYQGNGHYYRPDYYQRYHRHHRGGRGWSH